MKEKDNSKGVKPVNPVQSGGPGGRSQKHPLSDYYQALVETTLPGEIRRGLQLPEGSNYGHAIALGQILAAIKGKTDAAREIREAIEIIAGDKPVEAKVDLAGFIAIIRRIHGLDITKPSAPTAPTLPISDSLDR